MDNKAGSIFGTLVTGNPLYDQELERAPWEIKSDHYGRLDSPELLKKSLNVIKDDHVLLVLASLDGHRYGNTILINFDQDGMIIDKPNNFDESSIDVFRIYFKDILGVWSFFQVQTISANEPDMTVSSSYPDALYRLQTRQYHRVDVPEGTRAVFREHDQVRDGGFVKDISAGGMLICTGKQEEQFPPNTVINDINITLPLSPKFQPKDDEEIVELPVIKQGRIVRTFEDSITNQICHGVAFETDGESEKELTSYIEIIKDNMLRSIE